MNLKTTIYKAIKATLLIFNIASLACGEAIYLNLQNSVLNPTRGVYQYTASNVIANTNALGRTIRYEWDKNDRMSKIVDALNNVTEFEYSAVGNLLRTTDRNGIVTENQFDDLHRLILTTENASGLSGESRTTKFEYDKLSNRTKIIDGNGFETDFEFDKRNFLSKQILPDEQEYSFTYDALGRLETKTTPLGEINYSYDDRGNLLSKVLPTGTYTYNYDVFNNLLNSSNANCKWTYNYDEVNRLKSAKLDIGGLSYNLNYNYTLARLMQVSSPAGAVNYTYDNAERITNIGTSDGDNFGYTYSALGEVLNKTRPNNVNESNTFNELGRLISISNTLSSKNLMSLVFTHDLEGNKLSETLSYSHSGLPGILLSSAKLFKYDSLYRLRSEKQIDPALYAGTPTFDNAITFKQLTNLDLDILGNRKTVTVQDGVSVISEEKYNTNAGIYYADETNKINSVNGVGAGLVSALVHDNNGNITDDGKNTYVFDVENKLLSATNKTTSAKKEYFYDAESRLIKERVISSGSEKSYLYNGSQIVEERNSAGNLLQWNIHGLGIDDLLRTTKAGIKYYPLTNDQNSVLAVTDIAGNVLQRYDYSSFGKLTVQDADGVTVADAPIVNTLFQGRELDLETGLYNFRARYYSPELGRFISHDPMNYVDGMNMYEGFRGNPVRYTDPTGTVGTDTDPIQRITIDPEGGGGCGGGSGGPSLTVISSSVIQSAVEGLILFATGAIEKVFGPKEENSPILEADDVKEGVAREINGDKTKTIKAVGQESGTDKVAETQETTNKNENTSGTEVANKPTEEVKEKSPEQTATKPEPDLGGRHRDTKKDGKQYGTESHHLIADQASDIATNDAPAVRIDKEDHPSTASHGHQGLAGKAFRKQQSDLVQQGKYDEALKMGVDDLKKVAAEAGDATKYDKHIEQMYNSLPQDVEGNIYWSSLDKKNNEG